MTNATNKLSRPIMNCNQYQRLTAAIQFFSNRGSKSVALCLVKSTQYKFSRQTRIWLLIWGLLSLASCRPTPDEGMMPLPTDRIARLQEWYVDGSGGLTPAMLVDTLRWLAVDKDGYFIVHALDSRYTYDAQNRLAGQTVSGHRYTESGPERSVRMHQYRYEASGLTISTTVDWLNHWSGPLRFSSQQTIPLNPQGLVEQQPQLGSMYSSSDNVFAGVSELFRLSLNVGLQDSLRRYDAQGYLTKATASFVYGWSEPWQLTQSVEAGNVISQHLQQVGSSPTLATTERRLMQYDRNRPAILNPHQFLGSVNRNLLTKILYYRQHESTPMVGLYRYEYDAKGRVVRYYVSRQEQSSSRLYCVGNLTYTD